MREDAVSAVLSEVLMIALVLILVPIVTISLMNQLPEDRVPTVNIVMSNIDSYKSVHFHHKGGDWIKINETQIIINDERDDSWKKNYSKQVFDLGDVFFVNNTYKDDKISIVTKNAFIFSGVAK